MMTFQIREARLEDAIKLVAGNAAMALETEGKSLEVARLRRGVEAVIRDPSKGFYLIAEDTSGYLGQLLITYEWSDWRNGTFFWIQSVYTEPHARRQGVYRRLYEHVVALAKERAAIGVRLYVERHNVIAQNTYAALGMSRAAYEMFEVDFVLGG
jgi:ribosomal protein S18 acetylase RimI-like enzyme